VVKRTAFFRIKVICYSIFLIRGEHLKLSKNFWLKEFVPREIYEKFGTKAIWFVDPKLIEAVQNFRDGLGEVLFINTWHLDLPQSYNYSGFRPPDCKIGASLSQHRFGRGADIKTMKILELKDLNKNKDIAIFEMLDESRRIRNFIRDKYTDLGITTIEKNTPSWVHIDIRPTLGESLLEVPYK